MNATGLRAAFQEYQKTIAAFADRVAQLSAANAELAEENAALKKQLEKPKKK